MGGDGLRDIAEFPPVQEGEYPGEGVEVGVYPDAESAVAEAARCGGDADRWANQGMAADDYWRARTSA